MLMDDQGEDTVLRQKRSAGSGRTVAAVALATTERSRYSDLCLASDDHHR